MKKFLLLLFFTVTASAQFISPQPYEICDINNDQFGTFDLTSQIPQILNGQNPNDYTVTFYPSLADAQNSTNAITNPNDYTNIVPAVQTLGTRITNNNTNEVNFITLNIRVSPAPVANPATLEICNTVTFPIFDLNLANSQITNTPNVIITYHETLTDAQNNVNQLPNQYVPMISTEQIIFARVSSLTSDCSSITTVTLSVVDCSGNNCIPPTNIAVDTTTSLSATVSWTAMNSEVLWEIMVVPMGSNPPLQTTMGIIASSNPFIVTNLQCNTNYDVYVRATCGFVESAWSSIPVGFTTANCGTTIVSVNNDYTPTQLISNVLLSNTCVTASSITSQGNCGIAYFNNNDGDFPFEEGLVIRSGNAILSAGGSYPDHNLSSTCSQIGDTDLNNIISASGQTGNVIDVSSVKFNFTAVSNLLTFNFLFASNEYGHFQCSFSDIFGFILTDLETGVKQNIAVIPGTSTPVSINTIRDNQYNSNCTSANSQFFGSYNVNNIESNINFIGQTVPMTAFAQLVPNRQYSLILAVGDYQNSSYDSAVFIEGGSFAFGNQCQDNFQLIAFIDANNNGIKDTDEINYSQGTFNYTINDSGDEITNQSSNGILYIFPENLSNSYDFNFSVYPELASYFSNTTSFTDVVFENNGNNIYYFPITNTQPYNDVEVTLTSFQSPVPGFTYYNTITYKNNGITPVSGTLQFNYDSILSVSSISQSGTTAIINGFTYSYTDLLPNETRIIQVYLTVPTIPTIELGQNVINSITSTNVGDINPSNNSFEFTQEIIGSYDPNDKLEAHGRKIEFSDFGTTDYLYYTIRFQNTGTANAQFVRLVDDLDDKLDETSLRMITASHDYTFTRTDINLVWKFDHINLPPEIVNEEKSNGFVQFKIKPKPGFAVGDIIPNTAKIYFDYNPAIITNTFETEFVQSLSNVKFDKAVISLYPNPAKNKLTINNSGTENIRQINIYEINGKKVFHLNKSFGNETQIDVSQFAKGMYLIEITSENNSKLTKKLIVE